MRRAIPLLFLLLLGASAARAQTTPASGDPISDPLHYALGEKDPVKRDEMLIAGANRGKAQQAGAAHRDDLPPSFKAEVEVTNRASQAIRSVLWTATLLDPDTGAVIRAYDVTTRADIAPGETKRIAKRLRTPRAERAAVRSSRGRPVYARAPVADLRVIVTGVTYADGTTSTTP